MSDELLLGLKGDAAVQRIGLRGPKGERGPPGPPGSSGVPGRGGTDGSFLHVYLNLMYRWDIKSTNCFRRCMHVYSLVITICS